MVTRSPLGAVLLPLFWLLTGCGAEPGEPLASRDGGLPVDTRPVDPEVEKGLVRDPCARRERGGWHRSAAYCFEMTRPMRMKGVFITAFEERTFLAGPASMPDRNDPRRYGTEIEVEEEQLRGFPGSNIKAPYPRAYALAFIGIRTKFPFVGCDGSHSYIYVPQRLQEVRFLGTIADADRPIPPSDPRYRPWKPSGKGGDIGRLEQEAFDRCGGEADDLSAP